MSGDPKSGMASRLYPAGLALAGLLFCIAAGLGQAESLCLTQGCSLYTDVNVFGVSLWWYGAGVFIVIGALCLVGALRLAWLGALVVVAVDCFFLGWMALSLPCVNCLIVAAFFLSLLLTLSWIINARWLPVLIVGGLWLGLFSPNLFAAGQELAGPWAIRGSYNSPVRVFFSPSCPACGEALRGLLANGERNLAFFPVAENEEDVLRIRTLEHELATGAPFARTFAASRDPLAAPDAGAWERFSLRVRLMRNKIALARMGAPRIPVILTFGVPKGFGSSAGKSDSGGLFSSQEEFSGCTQLGDGLVDCDDPSATPSPAPAPGNDAEKTLELELGGSNNLY